jgi:hypothetical protein
MKEFADIVVTAGNRLTSKQRRFVDYVSIGLTHAEAYRRMTGKKMKAELASRAGYKIANRPAVKQALAELSAKSIAKTLLTMNDRLELLANIAQHGKPADRIRAIDVYSKISGDRAPDSVEHSGPGGGPIPITTQMTEPVRRLSVRDKIAIFKSRRESEAAQNQAAGRN